MGLVIPDFGLLFWMVFVFIIVLVILKVFAWKPILNSLKEREDSIEDALLSAEKAREEMSKLKEDNDKILAEARQERNELLKEARDIKQKIIDEAKEKAVLEGNKMIEAAKLAIKNEKTAALDEMKQNIATISIDIAEKILKQQLKSSEQQKDLMEKYIKDIKLN
ncbi:MAG: F0F1 ATP synthase subunit B [Bacteroidales bacterium]|nr:F0F1 ATP synthase subunit B [Bacteroidales bacterium]MBN2756689.1 F0F1 ATP synthase subunit B [Bacteroidales bacterium]